MSFDFDVTHPGDTDAVAAFPANERSHRLAVSQSVAIEHDVATGHHKIGVGSTATRNAITDWVVGALWFNTTGSPAVLQRVVSIGPVVWESIQAAGSLIGIRNFGTAGTSTYTPTAGTASVVVEVIAGGGAGGGAGSTTATQVAGGGGGGAGGYARSRITSAFSGVTITVGAGGTSAGAVNGTAGGASSFGALVVASGGAGGLVGSPQPVPTFVAGAVGGTGTAGDILAVGGGGGASYYLIINGSLGGWGGASYLGGGGQGINTSTQAAGNPGVSPGSGGAGGACAASQAVGIAGGAGRRGIVTVWEYA